MGLRKNISRHSLCRYLKHTSLPFLVLFSKKMLRRWLNQPWFTYSLNRDISLPHFNIAFLSVGVVYVVFITFINVIAVGYENKSVLSTIFNGSGHSLWYVNFIKSVYPTHSCNTSTITVTDGVTPLGWLILALATDMGFFPYTLYYISDDQRDHTIDGLQYQDYALLNCSVDFITMGQYINSPAQDQVILSYRLS